MAIQRLSEFEDKIGMMVLSAPDHFSSVYVDIYGPDQGKILKTVFAQLDEGFHFIEKKVKDPVKLQQLRQLLKDSLAAYQAGDEMKGAHLLQDFEDIVWPNRFEEYAQRKGIADL